MDTPWVNRGLFGFTQNLKTELACVHEQSEFTYRGALVAAGQFQRKPILPG